MGVDLEVFSRYLPWAGLAAALISLFTLFLVLRVMEAVKPLEKMLEQITVQIPKLERHISEFIRQSREKSILEGAELPPPLTESNGAISEPVEELAADVSDEPVELFEEGETIQDPLPVPKGDAEEKKVSKLDMAFDSMDDFMEVCAPQIKSDGMFVRTELPKPVGTQIAFSIGLQGGETLLAGMGEVVLVVEEPPSGMVLRFVELTEDGKAFISKIGKGPE